MLVEFKLKNALSFKNEVVLSMVPAAITENEDNLLTEKKGLKLLKSAVIYGANSSGKSNLFKALKFMRGFVINSSKDTQAGEPIPIEPFKLVASTEDEPSSFEIVFIQDDILFRYGFSVNPKQVTAEWLFYKPNTREIELFNRENHTINIHPTLFKEGQGLNNKDSEKPRTRDNALFLSVVAQFDGELSKKVIAWFRNLRIISGLNDNNYMDFSVERLKDSIPNREKTVALLKSVGLNIDALRVVSLPEDIKTAILEKMPPFIKKVTGTEQLFVQKKKYNDQGIENGSVIWSISQESEGTQKLIGLSGPIFDTLENNRVLVIDEFDTRLHPLMTKALISLFHSSKANPDKAQFVFSTHDTNLLSGELFRRDQIWFTEKDPVDSTDLYSLVAYKLDDNQKVRKDADYKKNYIAGRYGAIPYINIESLKRLLSH
ncbi:MAG: ATP/GTP-binding protein [Candidatus Margulisiibacteriota bacterium]